MSRHTKFVTTEIGFSDIALSHVMTFYFQVFVSVATYALSLMISKNLNSFITTILL